MLLKSHSCPRIGYSTRDDQAVLVFTELIGECEIIFFPKGWWSQGEGLDWPYLEHWPYYTSLTMSKIFIKTQSKVTQIHFFNHFHNNVLWRTKKGKWYLQILIEFQSKVCFYCNVSHSWKIDRVLALTTICHTTASLNRFRWVLNNILLAVLRMKILLWWIMEKVAYLEAVIQD